MRFHPNSIARSLRTKTTFTLGLIINDITNPFYPEITKGAEDIANKYNYNIILCNSDYNPEKELKYLKVLEEKRVDGILITPASTKINTINFLKECKIPFVLVDTKPPKMFKANCVYIDQEYGIYLAAKYLLKKGHKKIALINGPKVLSPCMQTEKGFKKALIEQHIQINKKYIKECNLKQDGGYKAMTELLSLEIEYWPTAVLSINDLISMGVYKAIEEKGLKIPDISIIGGDNIPGSEFLSPPLTTLKHPKYKLGAEATNILIRYLTGKDKLEHKEIRLLSRLIERKSVKNIF